MNLAYAGLVFETLAYSLLWILACSALVWLHSLPDAGHKRDLSVGAMFFGVNAISQLLYAWNLIQGPNYSDWIVHLTSGIFAITAGCYGAMRIGHFAVTLIRSERIERIQRNKIGDAAMEDLLLPLASAALRQGLEDVRQNYESRGIKCQPRSAPTSSLHSPLSVLSSR